MSVREEDKQKPSCSGRGLGLAAAAIGVGVGAALYYFLSKKEENPEAEGSSRTNWQQSDHQETLLGLHYHHLLFAPHHHKSLTHTMSDQSDYNNTSTSELNSSHYSTLSSSSDTDMTPSNSDESSSIGIVENSSEDDEEREYSSSSEVYVSDSINEELSDVSSLEIISMASDIEDSVISLNSSSGHIGESIYFHESNLTNAFQRNLVINSTGTAIDPVGSERQCNPGRSSEVVNVSSDEDSYDSWVICPDRQMNRERTWSLEECSICCEVMLRDHNVQILPCGHKFHGDCVKTWLNDHQTCPNCRKTA